MSVDTTDSPSSAARRSPRIRTINAVAIVIAAALAIVALNSIRLAFDASSLSEDVNNKCIVCASASAELLEASNYLTSQVSTFVVTGDRSYLDRYLEELNVKKRRDKAVETLNTLSDGGQSLFRLERAFALSNALAEQELYAMRLVCDARQIADVPVEVASVNLSAHDASLGPEELLERASDIVFGEEYLKVKGEIGDEVSACTEDILHYLDERQKETERQLDANHLKLEIAILLLLLLLVIVIFANIFLILWPLTTFASHIRQGESLHRQGAFELRYLVNAYNSIYEENGKRTEALRRAAERDPLTGLFNRGAYNDFLKDDVSGVALLLIDIDDFKSVNDTYGHDTGDALLKKVAGLIAGSFREKDMPCRLGGDEFAVIMVDMQPDMKDVICGKIEHIARVLADGSDGLPTVTISAGIAFGDASLDADNVYRNADTALYFVKGHGRDGFRFFGEEGAGA